MYFPAGYVHYHKRQTQTVIDIESFHFLSIEKIASQGFLFESFLQSQHLFKSQRRALCLKAALIFSYPWYWHFKAYSQSNSSLFDV